MGTGVPSTSTVALVALAFGGVGVALAWHGVRVCLRARHRDWPLHCLQRLCYTVQAYYRLRPSASVMNSGSSVHTKDSEDVTGGEEQVVRLCGKVQFTLAEAAAECERPRTSSHRSSCPPTTPTLSHRLVPHSHRPHPVASFLLFNHTLR